MDRATDTIFQDRRKDQTARRTVYVSVDHEHGRLYQLLIEEEFRDRLPYHIVLSPDYEDCSSQKERAEQVKQMRDAVREADLFLVICSYDGNRSMPRCRPFGQVNWQNLEIAEAGKRDLPVILVRTRQTDILPEQLEGMMYLETRQFDLRSISRLLEDAVKYWKL